MIEDLNPRLVAGIEVSLCSLLRRKKDRWMAKERGRFTVGVYALV